LSGSGSTFKVQGLKPSTPSTIEWFNLSKVNRETRGQRIAVN